jgi:FKBP-type peptidyl-prolyl cis-trans isomerase
MSARAFRWFLSLALVSLAGCENKVPEPDSTQAPAKEQAEGPVVKELVKEDLKVGTGPVAETGDKVKVHYTGKLVKTNFKFDSSVGKDPFEFTIGEGGVIKGWDQGVVGMKVGGKRKLTIPSDLAYGKEGKPPTIPPDAPLTFDIELLSIDGKGDAKDKDKDEPKEEELDESAFE